MAAGNTQFSIAMHIMAGLGVRSEDELTSGEIAESVNTCSSFIRRVMSKLAKADLVVTTRGKLGSCRLARAPKQISLLEIYKAVEAPKVFSIHEYATQRSCSVSCRIKSTLETVLDRSQSAFEKDLALRTLADVIHELKRS